MNGTISPLCRCVQSMNMLGQRDVSPPSPKIVSPGTINMSSLLKGERL